MNPEQIDDKKQTSDLASSHIGLLTKIIVIVGGISLLIGRWYEQWYYAKFNISYAELELSEFEYVWSSWTTWLSTISVILITYCIVKALKDRTKLSILSFFFIIALTTTLILLSPVSFVPEGNIFIRVFGSKDIALWIIGFMALLITNFRIWWGNKRNNKKDLLVHQHFLRWGYNSLLRFESMIGFILMLIGLMSIIGFFVAEYQADAAIKYGKMDIKNTFYQGKKWHVIKVGRKVFLFKPTPKKTIRYNGDIKKLSILPFKRLTNHNLSIQRTTQKAVLLS